VSTTTTTPPLLPPHNPPTKNFSQMATTIDTTVERKGDDNAFDFRRLAKDIRQVRP
jgi:hypothetical protein